MSRLVTKVASSRQIVLLLWLSAFMVLTSESQLFAQKRGLPAPAFGSSEISEKLELAEFNRQFLASVEKRVGALRQHEVLQTKIRDYPAGAKIAAFLSELDRAESLGLDTRDILKSLARNRSVLFKGDVSGDLVGTVTVEGTADPFAFIQVVAFDIYGYPVAAAEVDAFSGSYGIVGLASGDYYVVTRSPYVDEFYDDVELTFFQNWRAATLVTVPDNGSATGIDFDLQRGATISGTIFQADGTTPIANNPADFLVSFAENPQRNFLISTFTDNAGAYAINIPATGDFKIAAEVFGFVSEFYDNQPDFLTADVIQIASFEDTFTDIDFSLEPQGSEVVEGGTIQGTVLGPASAPVSLAFVFAFDTADTTIAGFGISGIFSGEYEIVGLDDGEYILYANHILDFVLPPTVSGEYYDNAATPDEATPVTITNMETKTGIDFNLDAGGAISGNITDSNSAPLDSVLILAVRLDLLNLDGFFVDDIDLGVAFSSSDGNYIVEGLGGGDFILRTVSLLSPNAGPVLDEYYEDVQSIFDFEMATPVTVAPGDTTLDINFVLQIGGGIAGTFYEFDGATPVAGIGSVVAFEAETGLPAIAFSTFDTLTSVYTVGPLATGSYNLLGTVTPLDGSDPVIYLPQFWDDKASLELANDVAVTAPGATVGIDFKMVRAATIQGFVSSPFGNHLGADSLGATVLAFEAQTGLLFGGADLTFSGGYRMNGLPPGDYKLEAIVGVPNVAGAYHGGGATFDDPNSTVVSVLPDEVKDADIMLEQASGVIAGTVYNADGDVPLQGVLVLAYDGTGHVVSAGLSGFDLGDQTTLGAGEYQIHGLRNGTYFVRTFSLFSLSVLFNALSGGVGGDLGGDPLELILGLLVSGPDLLPTGLDLQLYADAWYSGVMVQPDLENVDLFSLLFSLFLGGGGLDALVPFFDMVPSGATAVNVSGTVTDINFFLPALGDILTSVDGESGQSLLPESFSLAQNFPNPFNPSTVINYNVARTAEIRLRVYNLLGQRIRTLFDGQKERGTYSVLWDGLNERGEQAAAGIYFLRLEAEGVNLSRKMLLVK